MIKAIAFIVALLFFQCSDNSSPTGKRTDNSNVTNILGKWSCTTARAESYDSVGNKLLDTIWNVVAAPYDTYFFEIFQDSIQEYAISDSCITISNKMFYKIAFDTIAYWVISNLDTMNLSFNYHFLMILHF
jgi:hypothetical protein